MTNNINSADSIGDVQIREAFSHDPDREPQGSYIQKLKDHASIEITRENAATMRCASFKAFDFVCRYITSTIGITKHRVYPALRQLGDDRCYHLMKVNRGDVFTDVTEMLDMESSRLDYDVMMRIDETRRFINANVHSKVYKVTAQTQTVALKLANGAGIRTSELNLYHAMHGLKVLIENEPQFQMLEENEIVVDVMNVLGRAERSLVAYCDDLERLRR